MLRYTLFSVLLFSTVHAEQLYTAPSGIGVALSIGPTLSTIQTSVEAIGYTNGASTISLLPHYSAGFTAALTLQLDHDAWDSQLIYYWNKNETATSVEGSLASLYTIANTFLPPGYPLSQLSGDSSFSFKSLFLEIGREVPALSSPSFFFRIHYGFAGTWEDEKIRLGYTYIGNGYQAWNVQDSWGAGLRCGAYARYQPFSFLSLSGAAAGSLLWNRFRCKRQDTKNGIQVLSTQSNTWQDTSGIDMELAVTLTKSLSSTSLSCKLSYFMQLWSNRMRLLLLSSAPTTHSDISVQGAALTLTASF